MVIADGIFISSRTLTLVNIITMFKAVKEYGFLWTAFALIMSLLILFALVFDMVELYNACFRPDFTDWIQFFDDLWDKHLIEQDLGDDKLESEQQTMLKEPGKSLPPKGASNKIHPLSTRKNSSSLMEEKV